MMCFVKISPFPHILQALATRVFFNKQYITLDNNFLLLYTVYNERRNSIEDHHQSLSHGTNL